jgi:hypothetical protein
VNDTNSEPELPRLSRPIATLIPTVRPPQETKRAAAVGVLSPFTGLLSVRLRLLTADFGFPMLSYLIYGGFGSEVANAAKTERRSAGVSSSDRPNRGRDRSVRTVVRDFVHVRESQPPNTEGRSRTTSPPATRTAYAESGVWPGDEPATSDQGASPMSGYPEWTVVQHGGVLTGEHRIPVVSKDSAMPHTTSRLPTVREQSSPLVDLDHSETSATRSSEPSRHLESRRPVRLVTASNGTRGRPSTEPARTTTEASRENRRGDVFGPPIDLTVRRTGGADAGLSATGGRHTNSVDLADLGGPNDQPNAPQSGPEQRPNRSSTNESPLLDLSRAPNAQVNRLVDQLYGELTRRHRIERERRGR